MPYNPLNPFESYTHVYSPPPPPPPPQASVTYVPNGAELQAAAFAREAKAVRRKQYWQAQAAKRKQERADNRAAKLYNSPECVELRAIDTQKTQAERERQYAVKVQAAREAKRQGDSYYRVLILDRRIDNKHHMRLIARKKVARSPNEVSIIHTEIKALLVKIRETKLKIAEFKVANKRVRDKANLKAALLPTAPGVEIVMPNPRFDAVVQHMQFHHPEQQEHIEDDDSAAYNAMHRIAQICQTMAAQGFPVRKDYLRQDAVSWLRIPLWQSYYLFAPERTMQDFVDWQLMTSSQKRLCIVSQDGNALAYIHDEHRTNELCIAAMDNTPEAFQFLTKKQRTKEVCAAAGMPYRLYIDPKKIKSYRVDVKMDAALVAAFQNS